MRDDELQVLGSPRKWSKRDKWTIAIVLLASVFALGFGLYWALSPQKPETTKTKKNPGEPTIVPGLQECVDSLLNAKLTEIDGLQGQVIVMEVQTGEILAMAGRERKFDGTFQPCNNFAYQQELGSLTKTASLLAALETGKAQLHDVVDTGNGIWPVGNGWIMKDHNWRRGGYGQVTLDRAMEVSSNIGISKTIWKIFKGHEQDFFNMLDSMSYGQPDNIDGIDGLCPTSYDSPKHPNWVNENILWSSIGYNRKMAPIQMLTFYNAIANNGKMVKPTLKTGEVEVINPQIASKANIASMQVVLDHVVSQGLGRKAGNQILRVAGKTGTSQVREYEFSDVEYVNEYQVCFCGYFPADEPKYSMIVSMNKQGLPASGGGQAGVLFHDIVEQMIAHQLPTVFVVDEEKKDTVMITPDNIRSLTDSLSSRDYGYKIHLGVPVE
jgi:cell division protein FtsI (penicillin-binding protein 3)